MITDRERSILERRARGDTQAEVATALNISQSVVCRVERRAYKKLLDAQAVINTMKELNVDVTPRTKRGYTPKR